MVFKVQVYFETDVKLSSEAMEQFISKVTTLFEKDLIDVHGRDFKWKILSNEYTKLKLKTRSEVLSSLNKQ